MFKKITFVFIVLALALSACTVNGIPISFDSDRINGSGTIISQDRVVSGFTSVDLQSIGNLTIVSGDSESLTITADDNLMQYITTEVEGNTLKIGMKPNLSVDPTKPIEYKLTVKQLSDIVLSGFGNIDADELSGDQINVRLSGSGNVTLGSVDSSRAELRISGFGNINVEDMKVARPSLEITGSGDIKVDSLEAVDLSVKISGFGNATINGSTTDQEIQIVGSGNFRGGDLESENTIVKITGFGNATVWAKESLDVTITGSGDIEYYGSPKISQTMTGFGKVNSLGKHE